MSFLNNLDYFQDKTGLAITGVLRSSSREKKSNEIKSPHQSQNEFRSCYPMKLFNESKDIYQKTLEN